MRAEREDREFSTLAQQNWYRPLAKLSKPNLIIFYT
jgi:hypothetical protein